VTSGACFAVRTCPAGCNARSSKWRSQLRSRASAREEGEGFADGGFLAGRFGQRQVCLDLVAVAAVIFLLHHVADFGQVGDDAVGAALGDAHASRDVAQPHAWVAGDAQQHPGMVGQETPAPHLLGAINF
jgi:hypothetical protein